MTTKEKLDRTITGVVVSSKMDKTIIVLVERKIKHPVYKKYIRKSTRLSVDDPENSCKEGDEVVIKETRPISKNKCWALVEIKTRAA